MQRTSAKLIALSMLIDATTASKSVLCLHGRGGSASTFLARGLEPLRSATAASYGVPGRERRAVGWNYDAIDALDASGGWWTYPKGQRSYSADSYTGAEASIAAVEAELATGKYSGLLGFSQGASPFEANSKPRNSLFSIIKTPDSGWQRAEIEFG